MEYRKFGGTGLQVSALSFGTWLTFGKQIADTTAEELMIKAYDAGINFLIMQRFTLVVKVKRSWEISLVR